MDTSTALVPTTAADLSSEVIDLAERANRFAAASMASSTKWKYATAWRQFSVWCGANGFTPLPARPEAVTLYVTFRADTGCKVSTIDVDLAAIACAHRFAGERSPTDDDGVSLVMQGIRRSLGTRPEQKAALRLKQLRRMIAALPADSRGARDHVVLVLGFASALRRSELVQLNREDITFTDDGIELLVRRSKVDQQGAGRVIGVPWGSHPSTCPVRVLRRWLEHAGVESGPLFLSIDRADRITAERMSSRGVARCVQRAGLRVGLDPAKLAGHSLRAGFCTEAAANGASERAIMQQSGHRSEQMVRRYVRHGNLWTENAANFLGL